MEKKQDHYVYIMTNKNQSVLYTGCTNDIYSRVKEHKLGINKKSFSHRYNLHTLVYVACFTLKSEAYATEWDIKHWKREWKIRLINEQNPEWKDLSEKWK